MEIKVNRRWKKESYTIGDLYCNGVRICNTLEDKDRGLTSSMPTGIINQKKIYGKTAIPTGTYKVVLSYSQKFAKKTWAKKYNGLLPELLDVKGYSGVRIHVGNTDNDTLGCLLLGENKEVGKVINSTKCFYDLMDNYIMPAWKAKEEITITIK